MPGRRIFADTDEVIADPRSRETAVAAVAAIWVGWLQLNGDDGDPAQPLRVEIPDTAFEEVHDLVGRARSALTEGTDLRWCDCQVCAQYPPVSVGMRHDAPVTNIQGISKRAQYLGAWGISSVGELVAKEAHQIREALNLAAYGMSLAEPGSDWATADYDDDIDDEGADWDESAPVLCDKKRGVLTSVAEIERWRAHAEVYIANKPRILPGTHEPIPTGYIALDLEYQETKTTAVVWTFCARTVGVADPRQLTVCADENHQTGLLAQLADFLAAHPDLPVITWSPSDISVLRKAATDSRIENHLIVNLTETRQHTDLLAWTKGAMILPTESMDLKTVAACFGIANDVPSMNGLIASSRMREHRTTTSPSVKEEFAPS